MNTYPLYLRALGLALLSGFVSVQATPLGDAIHQGDRAKVVALLAQGAEINETNESGATALHMAGKEANKELIELLLACGAKLEAKDKNGLTALEYAALGENRDAYELLSAKIWSLPPAKAAEEALQKGIDAAKNSEPLKAIRFFDKARVQAPGWPLPLYYLGLLESTRRGRELRAYCWFKAFLSAAPESPAADVITQEMAKLLTRNQVVILQCLQTATTSFELLPGDDSANPLDESDGYSDYTKQKLAGLWAQVGEAETAMRFCTRIQNPLLKNLTASELVSALNRSGKGEQGRKILADTIKDAELIERSDDRAAALSLAANVMSDMGDTSGALTLAARIDDADQRSRAQLAIARTQAQAGDFAASTVSADSISVSFHRSAAHASIALAALRAGNRVIAAQHLQRARSTLLAIPHDENAVWSLDRPAVLRPMYGHALREGQKTITWSAYRPRESPKVLTIAEAESLPIDQYAFSQVYRDCSIVAGVVERLDHRVLSGYAMSHSEIIYEICSLRAHIGDLTGARAFLELARDPFFEVFLREQEIRARLAEGYYQSGDKIRAHMELSRVSVLNKSPQPIPDWFEAANAWTVANQSKLGDSINLNLAEHLRDLPKGYTRQYYSALLDTIASMLNARIQVLNMSLSTGRTPRTL